jgi:type I restriction enzyme S subunit
MTPDSAPVGWKRARYGDALVETDERAGDRTFLPVLSVTKSRGPMLASERFGKTMHGRDLSRYRVAPRNHIVADPMLLWDGSIGVQQVVDAGLVSPDYRVYKPAEETHPTFMAYLVRSPLVQSYYQGGARGTNVRRNRIARSDFLSIPLSLPPLGEQRKIAAILSSMDDAIEATQAVIDQLQVVKKAMMAELLTRGLPGRHTRFQQTEIGEVPADWSLVDLGDTGEWLSGGTPSKQEAGLWEGPIPWVSPKDMKRPRIDDAIDHVSEAALQRGTQLAPIGSILMVVRGMILAHTFPVAVTTGPVAFNQDIKALVPRHDFDSEFLLYWLQQRGQNILTLTDVSNHGTKRLPSELLFASKVPKAPLPEQRSIVEVFRSLDARATAETAWRVGLSETKAALMSVLLTGEVRVTPDEAAA